MSEISSLNHKDLYIVGAGAMAREVYFFLKTRKMEKVIKAFVVEDKFLHSKKFLGVQLLGLIRDKNQFTKDSVFILAIGNPIRFKIVEYLENLNVRFITLYDYPYFSKCEINIGTGSILLPGCQLTTGIVIGNHCIVNIGCTISHDVKIGHCVTVCPGVNIGGEVKIGNNVFLGIGATVSNRVSIGDNAFIGAGTVVVNNVGANTLVYGNPGREIRIIEESERQNLI